MKNKIILGFVMLAATFFYGCESNDPMSGEQYEKVVYVVGAAQNVITRELPYSSQVQETFMSVAISGSKQITHDVSVDVKHHDTVVEWYNNKYKFLSTDIRYQVLFNNYYSIPSYSTTIKEGETYARVPISITTAGLHCDSLYALTFAIEGVSDYTYNQTDSALIMTFSFVNQYSGNYLFSGTRSSLGSNGEVTSSTSMTYTRTFKATNPNTVRFYNEQITETAANIKDNCLTFSVNTDGSVSVSAWEDFDLKSASCAYDAISKTFTFDYTYNSGDTLYKMEGTFTYQDEAEESGE